MTPQQKDSNSSETERFLSAVAYAFDILGPVCRQRLYEYLKWKYYIDVREATKSDLTIIQKAISEIFGDGAAQLLMKQIYTALDKPDSRF